MVLVRPPASTDSRKFARLSSAKTGTVFGTVSPKYLEPWAVDGRTDLESMVGVRRYTLFLRSPCAYACDEGFSSHAVRRG
jgi:hypothetical protein